MAYVEDRWLTSTVGEDGKKANSARHGTGRRWRVRYQDPDGTERSKSFEKKADADNFRDLVAADLRRGTYLDLDSGKISLRKYAEYWLSIQTFDDATRTSTAWRLTHILGEPGDGRALGGKRLDQIASTPSLVQAWVKSLKLAPSTAALCLSTLSSIFIAAMDDGKVTRNPCKSKSVRAPKPDEHKVVPLEADELAALRDALPARYRAVIEAGSDCGMRQGEVFGFSPADIDEDNGRISVKRQLKIVGSRKVLALPKRGKTRVVPVGDFALAALAEHARLHPPVRVTLPWHEPGSRRHGRPVTVALMFTTPHSQQPVTRNRFNVDVWKPALRKAGVPDTRENGMHVLRHSFASRLLSNGVDIKRVAACLGHSNPAFTLRVYTHLMRDGEDQVRRALDSSSTGPRPVLRKIV